MSLVKSQLQMILDLGPAENRVGRDIDLDPIDATFRDSAQAPLHSWFPYLEGYSPRFVDRVRSEYLPAARRIIDPFAGSGTTPIVLGQSGIASAYAEVNPAMAFVIQTKLDALRLTAAERKLLSEGMRQIARHLKARLKDCPPDEGLRAAYSASFGTSIFYEQEPFEAILRLRSVNDEVNADNKLLGNCLTLAILSALIPSSLLKRAGDLRFKTPKELASGYPTPVAEVSDRLRAQAADLLTAGEIRAESLFACNTAKELGTTLEPIWDGVITSPPYLNGTNYIRNARLELWYLRSITEKIGLRRLRDQVITSGINDVDVQTRWEPVTKGVKQVVAELQKKAYDDRIAKMVGGYFFDMAEVFKSLTICTNAGARICVDIGDSIYAGVHVPTDDLLVEVAESVGLRTLERMHLRKRTSKGGAAVRQQLLVFENPGIRSKWKEKPAASSSAPTNRKVKVTTHSVATLDWRSKWERFKKDLPHQIAPYSKREWGGPVHSMCSYQGKMKAALAHHLIQCFSSPGDVIVDPFSGAGTIPFEACRMARRGYGIDISELGHVLTFAKVGEVSATNVAILLRELESYIRSYKLSADDREDAAAVKFNSAIPDYFHPETFREVVAARTFFLSKWNAGPEWALLFASTLHLLHGNRPYALSRRSHPVTPFAPTGPFEYRELMPRLIEKLDRMHDALSDGSRRHGNSAQADCTQAWPVAIPQAEAVITSPPFFDSTRFYMTNWMRFWFVGWSREDFDKRTGNYVENRQKKTLDVYRDFFRVARAGLKESGIVVLHLGQSPKCDMGAELAKRVEPFFTVVDSFTEDVEHCESHGVRDKGTVSGHTYLVLAAR